MENVYYIAGHRFRVQGEEEIALLNASPAYSPFLEPTEQTAADASCPFCHRVAAEDWQVLYGALSHVACCEPPCNGLQSPVQPDEKGDATACVPPPFSIRYGFQFPEAGLACSFGRQDDTYLFRMQDAAERMSLLMSHRRDAGRILATAYPRYSSLHFSLWFAFAMLAAPMSIVPVHASTLVYQNHAVMILGESGTGKSTHTALWCRHIPGAWLLNDDSPLLSVGKGVPMVYGSPWSGKTPCFHNLGVPLRGIVRLSQAPHNRIRRLSPLQAIAALHPSCPPALTHDDYFNDLIMEVVQHAVTTVPVYHLECLPDAAAALLCRDTLFASSRQSS